MAWKEYNSGLRRVSRISRLLVAVVSLLLAAAGGCNGGEYEVGGDEGWILGGFNYAAWAKQQRFQAGDTLLFQYPPGAHTVLQVSEQDYKACVTSRPVLEASGGNNIVLLSRGGSYWFICGIAEHCSGGMKFSVKAAATHNSAPITTQYHQTSQAHTANQIFIAYPTEFFTENP